MTHEPVFAEPVPVNEVSVQVKFPGFEVTVKLVGDEPVVAPVMLTVADPLPDTPTGFCGASGSGVTMVMLTFA
jgi:hypothetical protein